MALSSIANSSVTQNSVNLKKSQGESKQPNNNRLSHFQDNRTETQTPNGDNVILSKAAETFASREVGQDGEIQINQLLPRTLQAIVENSKTALTAQANLTPQSVEELLA